MANIALYPGGYKPPHIGHYEAAKEALTQADKVIVFVGPKEREGITQDMSISLWELYTEKDNIEIRKAGVSPVKDVYDFVELEAEDGDILSFIKGEKDIKDPRFARIPTYAKKFGKKININFINISNKTDRKGYPVSGTWMRGYIKKNNFQDFTTGLPKHLSAEQENEAWAIVIGLTDYSSPKGGTQSSQFEENVFSKKWWKDILSEKEEPYGDTTAYRDHWKSSDPGPKKPVEPAYKYKRRNFPFYSMYETRGGEPELHIYDFDETIARVETPIPYTVKSSEGEIIEKGETTSIEFEETKDKLKDSYDEGIIIDWDFKAFANLISKATINNEIFQKLLNSIKNPNAKVTILTARAVGLPVTKFLKDQGIWAYVVPLGQNKEKGQSVTGEDKANWVEKRLKDTTKKVIFIDDAPENRKAIYTLRDKYPDIEFSVETPPEITEQGGTMTNQEKAKHAKNLKRLNKDLRKQGDQYIEVPSYLKGTLTRKLYENHTTSTALINNSLVPLETMNTPEQQMTGMMGRDSLEGGMLFPYDTVQRRDFHMKNCKIPLDIIFIKQDKINNIHHNCPPCKQNDCPNYSGMADNVLELSGGYCKRNNINIGDKINLNINPNIQDLNKMDKTYPDIVTETRLFSKDWWLNILTEGGAAGHMAHPFNLPNVNDGKSLLDVFKKTANSLEKNPGSVKIDGVNSSIRLVDLEGKKQFVMDRGSKKPLDIKGITKADLKDRFKKKDGSIHGMIEAGGNVLDMFNEALPSLENDLKKLGAWDDPNILFNMEYVEGKTNVQDYGSNFIAIHGLNKIESKEVMGAKKMLTKRISKEISYDKSALQSLLDNLEPTANKNNFKVYGSVPTEMVKKPNFGIALSQQYTIKSNEGDKTQSLDKWLNELNDIPEETFIFMDGIKRGAVSKLVYTTLLNGGNIDELFENEEDKQAAVEGFTTYLATEKLGDEILKVLDSPMGSADNHEGVVIRDKKIANVPFKITGKFILGGMASDF